MGFLPFASSSLYLFTLFKTSPSLHGHNELSMASIDLLFGELQLLKIGS
jgi:hypothetical protein